jgi:hypothetical protein
VYGNSPESDGAFPHPASGNRSQGLKRLLAPLGCLLGIAVTSFLYLPVLPYIVHGNNDFICFYAAAELAGTKGLYDVESLRRAESELGDRRHFVVFTRLPYYAAWISPLRFFSFETAYRIWQTASLAGVLLFVYFWPAPARWTTAMACCWSLPLLEGFISGQDVPILMAALGVSLSLWSRGRHFAAGCVLSLCSIKYNLFLTFPLLIAGRRLWRFGGGAAAGAAVLWAVSISSGGWDWPRQYAAIIQLPNTTPDNSAMPNLNGLVSGLPHSVFWEAAGACLVVLAAWLVVRGKDISYAIAATLVSGLLVSHHAFLRDAVLLIPACLLMLSRATGTALRVVAILVLCPLVYVTPIRPGALVALPLLAMAAGEIRNRLSG